MKEVSKRKLTEEDINIVVTTIVQNYQLFDNDVVDLINASGLSEKEASKIVRKRYKDFIIN